MYDGWSMDTQLKGSEGLGLICKFNYTTMCLKTNLTIFCNDSTTNKNKLQKYWFSYALWCIFSAKGVRPFLGHHVCVY